MASDTNTDASDESPADGSDPEQSDIDMPAADTRSVVYDGGTRDNASAISAAPSSQSDADMNPIAAVDDTTLTKRDEYLGGLGWTENPFARPTKPGEYVLPGDPDDTTAMEDVVSHLRDYTGPVVIHSEYSGVGKTTLLEMILDAYEGEYLTAFVREHNVSAYELAGLLCEQIGVAKSNSTKYTEERLANALADADRPLIAGVDEFGLNAEDTLHVIQYINDLPNTRVVLTGMTSQWDAIGQLGSDGRAFRRRCSFALELEPFSYEQSAEFIYRRIASAREDSDVSPGASADEVRSIDPNPFTPEAIDVIHERGEGIPGVISAAVSQLIGLAAYRNAEIGDPVIDAALAAQADYADPNADRQPGSSTEGR